MSSFKRECDMVAIVPARGGSKRLPRKNVLELAGKPLIQWTLDAANKSRDINLVVVTSDDDEVLDIAAKNTGVKLVHRPESLASDTATSVDVALHALKVLEEQGVTAKHVVLLQPTSPLRQASDINGAIEIYKKAKASSVISICEADHPPEWYNTVSDSGSLDSFIDAFGGASRSQEFKKKYRFNGAIYIVEASLLYENKTFACKPSFSYIMPKERSIDIDDSFDFKVAAALIGEHNK